MLRDQIKKDILPAISNLHLEVGSKGIDGMEVTRTNDSRFGDFTTNIALKVSHKVKQSPMEFAKILADSLQKQPYIKKLEVVKPGFLNFFVKEEYWQRAKSKCRVCQCQSNRPFAFRKRARRADR